MSEESTIFKNEAVFSPEFFPPMLLHRGNEIDELAYFLKPVLKNNSGGTITLVGPTGVGKTTLVRYVLLQLQEVKPSVLISSIHAPLEHTRYSMLVKMLDDWNVPTARRGHPPDALLSVIEEIIENRVGVVVLDELDHISKNEAEAIINDIMYLRQVGKKVSAIVVINEPMKLRRHNEKVKHELLHNVLHVKPYKPAEVRDILSERCKLGLREGAITQDALGVATAMCCKRNADIRYGLSLLLSAGRHAEKQGRARIEVEDVKKAGQEAEHLLLDHLAQSLTGKEKELFKIIEKYAPLTSGELYRKTEMNERTIRKYLKKFDELGLIRLVPLRSAQGNTTLIELV